MTNNNKPMKFIDEFKALIMKGNVLDMAVGVIIGLAMGAIVTSLVNDIIMPPIGALLQGINFSDLQWVIMPGVAIKYGSFLQALINFLIIALVIFIIVKMANRITPKKEDAAKLTTDQKLLTEIRDELKETSR